MSWNYRILAHQETDGVILQVHRVSYENDKPVCYSEKPATIIGDTPEEMREAVEIIRDCFKKPILWAGEKFPEIYKS